MQIYKLPFLVIVAECLLIISKKIPFIYAVKEIIPFIYDGFKTSASDGFRFFRHDSIKVLFPLVLWFGMNVNTFKDS